MEGGAYFSHMLCLYSYKNMQYVVALTATYVVTVVTYVVIIVVKLTVLVVVYML